MSIGQKGGGPGKACPKSGQTYGVTTLDGPIAYRFTEGNGNGSSRGIAVALNVVVDLIVAETHFRLDILGNPQIGLMWNEAIDVRRRFSGGGKGLLYHLHKAHHGIFEDEMAIHVGRKDAWVPMRGGNFSEPMDG